MITFIKKNEKQLGIYSTQEACYTEVATQSLWYVFSSKTPLEQSSGFFSWGNNVKGCNYPS